MDFLPGNAESASIREARGQLVRTADVIITLPIERVETHRDVHAQRCQPPNERFGKPGAICNQHGEEAEGAEILQSVGNIVA